MYNQLIACDANVSVIEIFKNLFIYFRTGSVFQFSVN